MLFSSGEVVVSNNNKQTLISKQRSQRAALNGNNPGNLYDNQTHVL